MDFICFACVCMHQALRNLKLNLNRCFYLPFLPNTISSRNNRPFPFVLFLSLCGRMLEWRRIDSMKFDFCPVAQQFRSESECERQGRNAK